MANTDDLIRFLKVDMVSNGTLIHFCDAGTISEKDFNQKDGSTKKNTILEMDVMVGDTMKKITYSPNKTTIDLLRTAWGKDTVNWVGETGVVQIVDQISFGKLTPILVVKPLTNLNKAAVIQAQIDKFKQAPVAPAPPQPAPQTVHKAPTNAWEEEEAQKNGQTDKQMEDFNNFQTK